MRSHSPGTKELWIVRYRKGWGIRLDHEEKPFALFGKKDVAIESARGIAQDRAIDLVIFDDEETVETREIFRPGEH